MADALALGASESNLMGVQVSPSAQINVIDLGLDFLFYLCYTYSMNKINKNLIVLGLEFIAIIALFVLALPNDVKAYDEYSYYRNASNPEPSNPKPVLKSIKPNSIENIQNKVTVTLTGFGFIPESVVKKNNASRPTTFIDSDTLLVDIYPSDMKGQEVIYLTVFNEGPGGGYSQSVKLIIKNSGATANNGGYTRNSDGTYNSNSTNTNSNSNSSNNNSNNYEENDSNYSNSTSRLNNVGLPSENESFGNLTANALTGSKSFLPTGAMQWIFLAIVVGLIIVLWRYVHDSPQKYMAEPLKHH